MCLLSSGVSPAPAPCTDQWHDEIKAQQRRLSPEERADPTWAVSDNDALWVVFFAWRHEEELRRVDGLIGPLTSLNKDGRVRF
jgi:hypothetical protein